MQPIVCRTSPAKHMTRPTSYSGRLTDTLSAFFLGLAMLLAGGYGPLTAQAAPVASESASDLGSRGHRSSPVIAKQQFVVTETRDVKSAPWDDGKPKAFLPPKGLDFAVPAVGVTHPAQSFTFIPSRAPSGFNARAPPARS